MSNLNVKSHLDTEKAAEMIGAQLKGGEIIELIGDVGAGKTTFVRGLAKGIGSVDRVTSPTFTVSQVYESDNLSLHHYDFYRLTDFAIIKRELEEVLQDKKSVVVLEWAEAVQDALPKEHLSIDFKVKTETGRELIIHVPDEYNYLELKSWY